MPELILITGGARSGKSQHALELTSEAGKRAYVATAEATDEGMAERIRRHRRQRDDEVITIEEPLDLAEAVKRIPHDCDAAIIDCLTVWLGNLIHHEPPLTGDHDRIKAFFSQLTEFPCDLVVVSNEVGMGIIPPDEQTRQFRDVAGRVNQRVADRASRVLLMVSGIAVPVSELEAGEYGV